MSGAAATFWQECDRYHDLAKQFEQNIEITHPATVSGRSRFRCYRCAHCAHAVTYYEYRGPRL